MALSARLELRQGQALVMTPQLLQAIKLLQLSAVDVHAYVEEELEKNPVLERDERANENVPGESVDLTPQNDTSGVEPDGETFETNGETAEQWMKAELEPSTEEISAKLDTSLENVFDDMPTPSLTNNDSLSLTTDGWAGTGIVGNGTDSGAPSPDLQAFVAEEKDLGAILTDQLGLAFQATVDLMIGRTLIDAIDDVGYFRGDLEQLGVQLNVEVSKIETVLAAIQQFEPAGVGARTLQECLAQQLREKDRFDPAMAALIDNLDLLAKRDFDKLRRICGVDETDLRDMLAEIKALDPHPGRTHSGGLAEPVVPDVFVRESPAGGWQIELNSDALPRVLVNQQYMSEIAPNGGEEVKSFISDCLQTANWLVKSLDQRARTILKVTEEIVRQQDAFFVYGVEHLRPLNLKTVADAISMHESTVSRVTSNKYMSTNRGTLELKYFFTTAISAADGSADYSAESVRFKIKGLVERETVDTVLSDDAIVAALRSGGVDIARRTVAKYRDALRIPSSVQRRRSLRV
jgi:RNA polymerase sigma-54 factor